MVYARQNIPKHTCIGIYNGEEFATKRQYDTYLKKHPNKNNSYAMEVSDKIIDSAIKGNFTRYANFSGTQDNAFYRLTKYSNSSSNKKGNT